MIILVFSSVIRSTFAKTPGYNDLSLLSIAILQLNTLVLVSAAKSIFFTVPLIVLSLPSTVISADCPIFMLFIFSCGTCIVAYTNDISLIFASAEP